MKPNFTFQKEGMEILPYEKRSRQFVFVGRLDKLKGIDFLFETWKTMGDTAPKLVVCGSGPMEEWCKDFIAEHSISNIQMLGQVDNEMAKDIMAHSLALVFPTQWYEGFPMTIAEAYSVGTPVIGPDMGNVGDLIEEGVTGWKYSSKNQIKTVIQKISILKKIIENENHGSKNFSKGMNYKVLLDIYQSVSGKI